MRLRLASPVERQMRDHALEAWPDEACGAVLGLVLEDGSARGTAYRRLENRAPDRRAGFETDPLELCVTDGEARDRGLTLLGLFHSHPGGDPQPSPRDAEAAWPGVACWIGAPAPDGGFTLVGRPLPTLGGDQDRSA